MKDLAIPGADLHALSWSGPAPDAPLALLLHGFPDLPRSWGGVAERLVRGGHRVVAPYLPGYFPSPPPASGDALSLADQMARALDVLAPGERIYLVGHDFGAALSYVMLARHPERFAAASTLAVPHLHAFLANGLRSPAQLRRSAYMAFFQLAPIADRVVPRDCYAFVRGLWRAWSPGFAAPEPLMEELFACLDRSMPAPLDWYRVGRGMTSTPFRRPGETRRLLRRRIAVPTLYLHGADDGCIGAEIIAGQERFFAGDFEQEVLPDAGHFLHVERPDAVAERLVRFFARHPR